MDIETFVKDTLTGIVRGVVAAQTETAGSGARISPRGFGTLAGPTSGHGRLIRDVSFSIAVTVEDSTRGGGGIKVLGVSAGADAENVQNQVSRVEFDVPITLPSSNE